VTSIGLFDALALLVIVVGPVALYARVLWKWPDGDGRRGK
jgi:hypothetical protein